MRYVRVKDSFISIWNKCFEKNIFFKSRVKSLPFSNTVCEYYDLHCLMIGEPIYYNITYNITIVFSERNYVFIICVCISSTSRVLYIGTWDLVMRWFRRHIFKQPIFNNTLTTNFFKLANDPIDLFFYCGIMRVC